MSVFKVPKLAYLPLIGNASNLIPKPLKLYSLF